MDQISKERQPVTIEKEVTRNRSPNISVKIYCFELINLTAGESGVADSSLKGILSPHDKSILSIVHSNNASLQRVCSLVIFQIINDLSQTAESSTELRILLKPSVE